jgi:hypothetical protein
LILTHSIAICPADSRVSVVSEALPSSIFPVVVIPVELIFNTSVPAIIQDRFVQSPPNQVVDEPLCGINDGAVADDAPEAMEGLVDRTEFITSQAIQELQVTDCGASA